MEIIAHYGKDTISSVYLAKVREKHVIEFAEAITPPLPIYKKWVLLISISIGCPIKCLICDAGGNYKGNLTTDEILEQIDFLIQRKFASKSIPVEELKIQLSRMGEPTFNSNVLEVLKILKHNYVVPKLVPSLSTIAPASCDMFLEQILEIKDKFYPNGNFQMQFSIHTTDQKLRDKLIPCKKWSFEKISQYSEKFVKRGDKKITLNFALAKGYPIEPEVLKSFFNPEKVLIKITPVNPTYSAFENNISSYLDHEKPEIPYELQALQNSGFQVIISIGEPEENNIGSNCGQLVKKYLSSNFKIKHSYASEKYEQPILS